MNVLRCALLILVSSAVGWTRGGRGGGGRGMSSSRSAIGGSRTSRSKPYFTRKYSNPGSIQHTSSFRSFIFGAAYGNMMFNSGRHVIQDSSLPISYENRTYYWGEARFVPDEELPIQCINRIDPQDPQFGRVYFENDSKPQEIMYACPKSHNCCGFDCCPESTFFTSIFSLLILLLILSVFGIFVIECIRWCLHCTYYVKHGRPRELEPLSI